MFKCSTNYLTLHYNKSNQQMTTQAEFILSSLLYIIFLTIRLINITFYSDYNLESRLRYQCAFKNCLIYFIFYVLHLDRKLLVWHFVVKLFAHIDIYFNTWIGIYSFLKEKQHKDYSSNWRNKYQLAKSGIMLLKISVEKTAFKQNYVVDY